MSGALGAFGQLGLIAAETVASNFNFNLSGVFLKPIRSLGEGSNVGIIIPDCTVQEHHTDRMQITQHPVETGTQISDHAFMLPFEVSLRIGFSDSALPFLSNIRVPTPRLFGSYLDQYQRLQDLMQARDPFNIVTGKRIYNSMLITDMEVTTDQHTENVLMIEVHCQQVIITSTSSVPATAAQDQAFPGKTVEPSSTGSVPATPAGQPSISGFGSGP